MLTSTGGCRGVGSTLGTEIAIFEVFIYLIVTASPTSLVRQAYLKNGNDALTTTANKMDKGVHGVITQN